MKLNHVTSTFKVLSALSLTALLTACPGGGGGGEVSTDGPTDPGTNPGGSIAITLDKIQGATSGSWIVDGSANVYTKLPTVTLEGTCTRGVATIAASVNGSDVAETASCSVAGTYTWQKTFASGTVMNGVSYAVILKAKDTGGTLITGATTSKTLIVDDHAPTKPVVDTVDYYDGTTTASCANTSGTNWNCAGNAATVVVTVNGHYTAGEGVATFQFPSFSGITSTTYPGAQQFRLVFNLTETTPRSPTFTVTDLALNKSVDETLTISHSSNALTYGSWNAGGTGNATSAFAGGPVNTAHAMVGNVGSDTPFSYDSVAGGSIDSRVRLYQGPVSIGAEKIYENP